MYIILQCILCLISIFRVINLNYLYFPDTINQTVDHTKQAADDVRKAAEEAKNNALKAAEAAKEQARNAASE